MKERIRFTAEMIGNTVVLHDSTTKSKHGVVLADDTHRQLLQEIIIACQSEFSKDYTATEIKQDILPVIVDEYAARNYIHETECYRLCSDGSILYNECYLRLDNKFALALDSCHISGVSPEVGPRYIKQELDKLNTYGIELGEAEAKHLYAKSIEASTSIENRRITNARKYVLQYISLIQCKNKYQEIKADPLYEASKLVKNETLSNEKDEQESVTNLNTF